MMVQKEIQAVSNIMQKAEKTAEGLAKKAWSVLDAATEKESPGEYLSPKAVRAVQGLEQE